MNDLEATPPDHQPAVAFFDLDETLTSHNTGKLLVQYMFRKGLMSRREVLWAVWIDFQFRWSLRPFEELALEVAQSKKGETEEALSGLAQRWFDEEGRSAINPEVAGWAEEHRRRGDLLVINTSGTRINTMPFIRHLKFDGLLCTELEVRDGCFTGKLIEPPCFGAGKLVKAEQFCEQRRIPLEKCYFYTDSHFDLPLLEEVDHPVAVNPTLRLYIEALRRKWEVRVSRPGSGLRRRF